MKIKSLIYMMLGTLISLTSCAQKSESKPTSETKTNHNVLVAYFSATGNTRRVATELADVTGGTLYEITPATPYTDADLDWTDSTSRSSVEMHDPEFRPPIMDKVDDISKYDTVFIGFPIWWYVAPTIINSFVENNNLEGKTVICFATSGGSPIEPCVEALKKQYPKINWVGGRLLNGASRSDLQSWIKDLGL